MAKDTIIDEEGNDIFDKTLKDFFAIKKTQENPIYKMFNDVLVNKGATKTPAPNLTPQEITGGTMRPTGKVLPGVVQGQGMDQEEIAKQNEENILYAEAQSGTPVQKFVAMQKLTQKPSSVSGFSASRPLLTPAELAEAAKKVKENPALLANYPIYQKSQITNILDNPSTPAQYGKVQEGQSGAKKTEKIIGLLEEAFNATAPKQAQISTWLSAPKQYAAQLTKLDSDLVAYDGLIGGTIGNLARTLFGEKGVLTDYDVARVKKALPDARNTSKEIAKQQFDYLKRLNGSMLEGTLSIYDYGSKDVFINEVATDLERIGKMATEGKNKPSLDEIFKK